MASLADERMSAIHLLRAGQTVSGVAQQLGRSERWVRKWWQRYQTAAWAGLAEQSRAPHRVPRQSDTPGKAGGLMNGTASKAVVLLS